MALAFVQSAVPAVDGTTAPAPRLRGDTKGYATGNGASVSTASRMTFATAIIGALGLSGARKQGHRSSRSSIVKCRAVPTEAEVAKAKAEADLATWACKTLEGQPQQPAMQVKAQAKVQAYEALKAALEQGTSVAPAATVPAAATPPAAQSAPTMTVAGIPSAAEVARAKDTADLTAWAAKTLKAKGDSRAVAMEAKAAADARIYEALKVAFEKGVPAAPAAAPAGAPVAAPASAPAAASFGGSGATKEDVARAKEKADLMVWAAKTLEAKGDHRAVEMKAKAQRKVQDYEALKAAYEQGAHAAPVAAASAARAAAPAQAPATAPQSVTVTSKPPTPEELERYKQELDLLMWAAEKLKKDGAPQAADMEAKAQRKLATFEAMKAMALA
mmetsp:Transcript_63842/g.177500  ORF Transcript_63842/g.177500 Transcript_63842/m.177500 type:complete len:388 (+) Transcript_63842:144-1307(+)